MVFLFFLISFEIQKRTKKKIMNKTCKKLMEYALKNEDKFLTGKPLKVSRYGVYPNKRISFVTFITERGMEETYNNNDCLASAITDSEKILNF